MAQSAASLYFENAAGSLWEEPQGFLRTYWRPGPRQLIDSQALFAHQLRALQARGWSRILIDQRDMQAFSAEEQAFATQWLPRAVQEGGYRHGALLVSPHVMVRLATAFVTTQIQGLPLVYRSFDEEAAARTWLLRQPASAR